MPEHDPELLGRYVRTGDEDAFRQIVERHIHLVWAAARRINRCDEAVRDIAQEVFTTLARKAPTLPPGTVLTGWLHRTACHVAWRVARDEARRSWREREATDQHALTMDDPARQHAAEALLPVLDAALDELPDADREVILLRYLAAKPLAEVGAAFHIGEDAAQKRVARATDRLRDVLQRRGVTVTGGLVTAALSVAAADLAPAGLASAVSAGALATSAPLTLLVLMKSKLIIASVVVAAVVGVPLLLELRKNQALEAELTALRARPVPTSGPKPVAVSPDAAELARLREEHGELLRLRAEITDLRRRAGGVGGPDAARRSGEAEEKAAATVEALSMLKMGRDASIKRIIVSNAGKALGFAARIYAEDHGDKLPTNFDQFRAEMSKVRTDEERRHVEEEQAELKEMQAAGIQKIPELLRVDMKALSTEAYDSFEFFPHERVIDERRDPDKILFRERQPRRLPNGTWSRVYCFADGHPEIVDNPTGDYAEFERKHTATAASAPKP